jgi:mono/diheme cytochrome c family protein
MKNDRKSKRTGATLSAAVIAALVAAPAAVAADLDRGKRLWEGKANCSFCHGWAGDGQGDPRSSGAGTSLRLATHMDREAVYTIIQCGRPATGMPYHDRFAYTDDRCFGVTAEDLGDAKPPFSSHGLQKHEMEAVTDYVMAEVIGAGPVTSAECLDFFGPDADICETYD